MIHLLSVIPAKWADAKIKFATKLALNLTKERKYTKKKNPLK